MKDDRRNRSIQIPIIKLNELTILETDEVHDVFFGIKDIDNEENALKQINDYVSKHGLGKSIPLYDFKNGVKIKECTWCVSKDGIMIFTNNSSTPATSLIPDPNASNLEKSFERVYWHATSKNK